MKDTNNSPDLSEFFSVLSKEKKESRQKSEEEIANPESGLSNLFQQLEEVHRETQKVSEEIPDNKSLSIRGLSPDDQNKLEAFSSLMNSVDISLQESQEETPKIIEPPIAVEVFNNNSEKLFSNQLINILSSTNKNGIHGIPVFNLWDCLFAAVRSS